MAGSSSGSSTSTGTSTSTPTVIQTPQSEWGLQLSQMLWALTQQQEQWASQMQAKGEPVTDQNIGEFFKLSGMGAGMAQNLLSRYQNVFQPMMDKFIQQASSYNSEARQQFMMGQAESTAGQADQQAMDETMRQLTSYGINPNSGRMTSQMMAMRMADAAARAGAGTQASVNTAGIGRQMTQQAAQMGQNVPGMTVNALNSAYQGLNGAEQAILGFINSMANARNVGANFANAAGAANKPPPVGQTTQSNQRSNSGQHSAQNDPGGGGGGNRNNRNQPQNQGQYHQQPGGQGQGRGGNPNAPGNGAIPQMRHYGPDAMIKEGQGTEDQGTGETSAPGWATDPNLQFMPPENSSGFPDPMGSQQFPGFMPNTTSDAQRTNPQIPGSTPWMPPDMGSDPWANVPTSGQFGQIPNSPGATQPQGGTYSGGQQDSFDQRFGGDWPQQGGDTFDQRYGDWPQQDQTGSTGDQGQYQPQGGSYQPQGGSYGSEPQSGMDQQFDPFSYQSPDEGSGSYGGGYAKGGKVRGRQGVLPTTGGAVSRNASPSQGRQTDDIPARLNAGEFVIPRDVAQHYGTKHFNDLIAKSRKLRTGMAGPPTGAKMKPALRMNPTFVSRGA